MSVGHVLRREQGRILKEVSEENPNTKVPSTRKANEETVG